MIGEEQQALIGVDISGDGVPDAQSAQIWGVLLRVLTRFLPDLAELSGGIGEAGEAAARMSAFRGGNNARAAGREAVNFFVDDAIGFFRGRRGGTQQLMQ